MNAPLAYFWGDDAFAIEHAVEDFARELGGAERALDTWKVDADDDIGIIDEIERRVLTAPLFGGGTLVLVRQPAALVRSRPAEERLLGIVAAVPAGNALAFAEVRADPRREGAATETLRAAVSTRGGTVKEFRTPGREGMERWIGGRAAELGVRLGPGAARLLAERVGAYVREADVDRRNQSLLASGELEKLALYRPGGVVAREDIERLVPESVPGSMWAFLDAVAARRIREAAALADRLVAGGTPLPVIVSQLHRRLRELLDVRDRLSGGTRAQELPRILRVQPYRAQKLAEQAAAWTIHDLEDALEALLAVDLETKGIAPDGRTISVSEERASLGLDVWIAERARRSQSAPDQASS